MPIDEQMKLVEKLRVMQRSKIAPIYARIIGEAIEALEKRDPSHPDYPDAFAKWREPTDPEPISPEVLAARCLGIEYGDPGPKLPPEWCRACWGDRYVWRGNTWGLQHNPHSGLRDCKCSCHEGEVWLAQAAE